jgi:hypothetical protein
MGATTNTPHDRIIASLSPTALKGAEWEVDLIGAEDDRSNVVEHNGETYIVSKNDRAYSVRYLRVASSDFEGSEVYDNHLSDDEFAQRVHRRPVNKEWLGTIVDVRWDEATLTLKGVWKVVDQSARDKFKNAHEMGLHKRVGLSIDTFVDYAKEKLSWGGKLLPIIISVREVLSVDLVKNPAAGGKLVRVIASQQTTNGGQTMADNQTDNQDGQVQEQDGVNGDGGAVETTVTLEGLNTRFDDFMTRFDAFAQALTPAESDDGEGSDDDDNASEGEESDDDQDGSADGDSNVSESVAAVEQRLAIATSQLTLAQRLSESGLTGEFATFVREQFEGRAFEESELTAMITRVKGLHTAGDTSGRMTEGAGTTRGNGRTTVTLDEDDKFGVALVQVIMGNTDFRRAIESDDPLVRERVRESSALTTYVRQGKPNVGRYPRLSNLMWERFNGDLIIDPRAQEAASTSTLTSIVKDTINLMIAANYAKQDRWYEPIVKIEEVATIHDATLVRFHGVDTLSVVSEGAPYTELNVTDAEETASFVKKGNFVSVTLEAMMKDNLAQIRRIPTLLADSWFNTLSALVANVFTVNSGAGPVLSDTGALFNATALGTAGGHANLLTTALSETAYGAARKAMRKQTNQELGAGRKLQLSPKYLLVPEDLEVTGLTIRNSQYTLGSDNNDINPYYQQFEVVNVPDWTDANDWGLVADPMRHASIHLIFPTGGQTPSVFTADSEQGGSMFTNDTIRYKVRMMTWRFSNTYDCAPVGDWRGLHKSNVA